MMIPVILGISFIIFTILALTPGDPAQMILGENATPEAIEMKREELGLNENFFVRYFKYMGKAVLGDLGRSYRTNLPVVEELMTRFPHTLILAFFGIGMAVVIGIPIGILSAVKQYTIIDTLSLGLALIMTSIPAFWLGLMLMLVFGLRLDLLPAIYDETWQSYVLPVVTLAIGSMATLIRMTRSTMLEVIREDYIRTARAKGAPEKSVVFKHALRNALLPVVTVIGINFGLQLGGAVICESVFSLPGLGTLMITSVRQKDVPMVMAAVLFVALTISIVNLLVDILYSYIDPRVKSQYVKTSR